MRASGRGFMWVAHQQPARRKKRLPQENVLKQVRISASGGSFLCLGRGLGEWKSGLTSCKRKPPPTTMPLGIGGEARRPVPCWASLAKPRPCAGLGGAYLTRCAGGPPSPPLPCGSLSPIWSPSSHNDAPWHWRMGTGTARCPLPEWEGFVMRDRGTGSSPWSLGGAWTRRKGGLNDGERPSCPWSLVGTRGWGWGWIWHGSPFADSSKPMLHPLRG